MYSILIVIRLLTDKLTTMKNVFVFLTLILCVNLAYSANFTFTGNGLWTDVALWDTYPGENIMAGDNVTINGNCKMIDQTLYTNDGTISITTAGALEPQTEDSNWFLINAGIFVNDGLVAAGSIQNTGSIDNYGLFSGVNINNEIPGITNNHGTMDSDGYIDNNSTFVNHTGKDLIDVSIFNTEDFENYGSISAVEFPRTLENSGFFTNHSSIMNFDVDNYSSGSIYNEPNAQLHCHNFSNQNIMANAGTLEIEIYGESSSGFTNEMSGVFNNLGTFNFEGLFELEGVINNSGTIQLLEDSEPAVTILGGGIFNNFGTLVNNAEVTFIDPFQNIGIIKGTGNFGGDITNNGNLEPGNSPGIMTINGDYTQGTTGILVLEIEGDPVPGVSHDQLVINGVLNLEGTVKLVSGGPGITGGSCYELIRFMTEGTTNYTEDLSELDVPLNFTVNTEFSPPSYKLTVDSSLPVELHAFSGKAMGTSVYLDWSTLMEINNEGYKVQKSADGSGWENIGFVKGKGNSDRNTNYTFVDEHGTYGINYYRLKQLDLDGRYTYSDVISVNVKTATLKAYVDAGALRLINSEGTRQIEIYNASGKRVFRGVASDHTIDISYLPSGVYFLTSGLASLQFVK